MVIIHYSLLNLSYPSTFLWEGGHILYIQIYHYLIEAAADFPIAKNFCQHRDKFLYGFHGNNHKPPRQVSLFSFKKFDEGGDDKQGI